MRIPSGVTDQYIYFVAVDATDLKTRETGLSSFTVYRSRNGGAAAAFTTPTINETSAGNMPGVYELLLDEDMTIDAGDDTQEFCLHITHAGMAPVTRTFELYRPKATAGETIGVSSGAVSNVSTAAAVTTVNGLAANVITATSIAADAITNAKIADNAIAVENIANDAITATKIANGAIDAATFATGAITAAAIAADAITDAKVAADVTIASVTGAVGSVTGNVGGNVTGSVGSVAGAVGSVTGNVGGNVVGSVGSVTGLTVAHIDASISSRASATDLATVAGYLDTEIAAILADTNELQTDWANGGRLDLILDAAATQASVDTVDTVVDAIKLKTDDLNFTVAGQVDANIQYVNDVLVGGTGAPGDEWGP
jgi:hypothetical protein